MLVLLLILKVKLKKNNSNFGADPDHKGNFNIVRLDVFQHLENLVQIQIKIWDLVKLNVVSYKNCWALAEVCTPLKAILFIYFLN